MLGAESAPAVLSRAVGDAAVVDGLRAIATLNSYVGDLSDHHVFRLAGQPYLFLSCGEGRNYHSELDTVEWVNFDKVDRVGQYTLELVRGLDAAEDSHPVGAPDGDPEATVEYEVAGIRTALEDDLPELLAVLGLTEIADRSALDRFAYAISGAVRR